MTCRTIRPSPRIGAEFFNKIGTKRTRRGGLTMSVHWGKAEFVPSPGEVALPLAGIESYENKVLGFLRYGSFSGHDAMSEPSRWR